MKDRPAGVTMIVILYFVLGFLSLLWSGLAFGVGGLSSLVGGLFGADQLAVFGDSTAWTGFLGLLAAVLQIVVAFGLLGMMRWAWALALVGVGVTVIQGIAGMFTGGLYGFMCGSLGLIVPLRVARVEDLSRLLASEVVLVYLVVAGDRGDRLAVPGPAGASGPGKHGLFAAALEHRSQAGGMQVHVHDHNALADALE